MFTACKALALVHNYGEYGYFVPPVKFGLQVWNPYGGRVSCVCS